MNHWHNYPFVRIAIPYILGIIIAINLKFKIPSWIFLLLMVICFSFTYVSNLRTYQLRNGYGITASLLFIFLGAKICQHHLYSNKINYEKNINFCIAYIVEPPKETEKSIQLQLKSKIIDYENNLSSEPIKIWTYIEKTSFSKKLQMGDELLITSKIKLLTPPTNPFAFDFQRYLNYKEIFYQTYIKSDQWKFISSNNGNRLKLLANDIRFYLLTQLDKHIFIEKHKKVAAAILFGYDQTLDLETRENFADAGAMHILCVSGLHVGIIYLILTFLFSLFKRFNCRNSIKTIILMSIIWLYAFITGLTPSVLRASTMLSFIIIGENQKRNSNIYNSISASIFLLLLFNPLMLMEVGFQLSYSAVIGIVSIHPILSKHLLFQKKILKKIVDILMISLAAQIGTFPLTIYYFHQFPTYFLLTNLFVVSFAGIIIYIGIIFFLLTSLGQIDSMVAMVLEKSISILHMYVENIAKLPYASINNLTFTLPVVILVYILIIGIFRAILYKNKIWFFTVISIICLITFFFVFRNAKIKTTNRLIIYDVGNGFAVDFIHSGENLLLVDSLTYYDNKKIEFAAKNHWILLGVKSPQKIIYNINEEFGNHFMLKHHQMVEFCRKKILLITDQDNNQSLPSQTNIDYIILNSNSKIDLEKIISLYHPCMVIINGNNFSILKKLQDNPNTYTDLPVWLIAKKGAFVAHLN